MPERYIMQESCIVQSGGDKPSNRKARSSKAKWIKKSSNSQLEDKHAIWHPVL